MCAHGPSVTEPPVRREDSQTGQAGPANPPGARTTSPLDSALRELSAAIAERKVEPICTAYLALRRAAHGMPVKELLERLTDLAGPNALAVVVSGFSHRKCFMCEDGTMPCQTCDGAGVVDRFPCPQCEGLGIEPCAFCQGAGLSDPKEIPEELSRAVLLRRLAHVDRDLQRLRAMEAPEMLAAAEHLSPEKRGELAGWLIRLQARLANLAAAGTDADTQQSARLGAAAAEIDEVLKALRPPPPPRPQPKAKPPEKQPPRAP